MNPLRLYRILPAYANQNLSFSGYISKPILVPNLVEVLVTAAKVKDQKDSVSTSTRLNLTPTEENPFFQFNIAEPAGLLANRRKNQTLSESPTPPLTPGEPIVIATPRLQ